MKILYVANDRRLAQLAANALHTIAQDVRVAWAGSLPSALGWVAVNQDVATVIVATQVQNQGSSPFVDRLRGLGLTAPIIVVASEQEKKSGAVGAADYVVDSQTLLTDLPGIVSRGLRRAQ